MNCEEGGVGVAEWREWFQENKQIRICHTVGGGGGGGGA